jgi:hypothetical protein
MTRAAKAKRREVIEPSRPENPLRDEARCIAAHAEYRRDDFYFPRTQSIGMRSLKWERRLPPMRPWGSNLVANLAFSIFA